jgi:DDE_Tnp_1-associated
MWINVPSLQESLADAALCEFRQSQGKRYALQSVLVLSCVAMMNGARSEPEIADWCARYGARWMKWLGIAGEKGPSAATLARIFRGVDGSRLEAALLDWSRQVLESLRLVDPWQDDEWDEPAEDREFAAPASDAPAQSGWTGGELLCLLGFQLRALLDRIAPAHGVRAAAERESLLVGLTLTGYLETSDLQLERRESAIQLPNQQLIPTNYLPVPWQRLAA